MPRTRKTWTSREIAKLLSCKSMKQARKLLPNRAWSSIVVKAEKLGHQLTKQSYKKWVDSEKHITGHASAVALTLERSKASVKQFRHRLRKISKQDAMTI